MKLSEFAIVVSGYAFRDAIITHENGDTYVFQVKDLVQGVPCDDSTVLARINYGKLGNTSYLKKDDVLIVARGMKSGTFRSTTFISNKLNVIASSSVLIVRIIKPIVIPEYVSLYLNSKIGQDKLMRIVTGSFLGALPRKELESLDIPIPPKEKQQAIVDLHKNINEQVKLLTREKVLKESIINGAFNNII